MQAQLPAVGLTLCTNGTAAGYACDGVDLAASLPLSQLGGGEGNDIWGWTDPATLREFAVMGRTGGVTFVEITNPINPEVVGTLPTHSVSSVWRDLKVYDSYAFIVSEAPNSGLQVFDLRQLVSQRQRPHVFTETAWLGAFSTSHNIAINEASGYAYVVGTNTCSGGLHMVDLRNPESPRSAGCYGGDGYTHDLQCVDYSGPDAIYQGREICFAANEDTLTIVDVTDKASPALVSRTGYVGSGYAHQGWLTDDHAYFLLGDELDELNNGGATKTYVWNVSSLARPTVEFVNRGTTGAIDHNQYVRDGRTYQSNYKAGLRVLTADSLAANSMDEVAFFDTHPESNGAQFDGTWSNYPYYRANVVAVSTIDRGLFILGYEGEAGSLHVADIDHKTAVRPAGRWRAISQVEVHDRTGSPVEDVAVTVRWSNGRVKTCVTGPGGRCRTRLLRFPRHAKVAFRIIDLELGSMSYASWLNEDADGDSDGFRDTVRRP